MAHGSRMAAWNHTAAILAMTAEINRDSKKRSEPFTEADFHPLAKKPEPVRAQPTDPKTFVGMIGQALMARPRE